MDDLAVVATTGTGPAVELLEIPTSGTEIGDVFVNQVPGRFDTLQLADGCIAHGPALVLPIRATDTVAGVLIAVRPPGGLPFSVDDRDMMAAFVDQAALAWQLATTQRRLRELDVLTDRDRIARDLHDHVIQRLFAVGLALQGTIPRARTPRSSNGSPSPSTICSR